VTHRKRDADEERAAAAEVPAPEPVPETPAPAPPAAPGWDRAAFDAGLPRIGPNPSEDDLRALVTRSGGVPGAVEVRGDGRRWLAVLATEGGGPVHSVRLP
jgi:hypothetical protein